MKREIAKFVQKCLICQHIKAEHQSSNEMARTFKGSWMKGNYDWGFRNWTRCSVTKSAHLIGYFDWLFNGEICRFGRQENYKVVWCTEVNSIGWRSSYLDFGPYRALVLLNTLDRWESDQTIQVLEVMLVTFALDFGGEGKKYLL